MNLDFVIRLGDIMQAVIIAAGGIIMFTQIRSESRANRDRLDRVDNELSKQTDILTRLASGEERMNGLDHRIIMMEQHQHLLT